VELLPKSIYAFEKKGGTYLRSMHGKERIRYLEHKTISPFYGEVFQNPAWAWPNIVGNERLVLALKTYSRLNSRLKIAPFCIQSL
jgi:hypothetical protein